MQPPSIWRVRKWGLGALDEKYMGEEEAQCWEKTMKMWIEGKREIDQLVILEQMI